MTGWGRGYRRPAGFSHWQDNRRANARPMMRREAILGIDHRYRERQRRIQWFERA